jgi:F-type H+-transporting ATPase subunit gamma
MPSLKEVRNRITSVNSTQQITKAMKMVAAAKLRRAQDRIIKMRPYAQKLSQLIAEVSKGTEVGASSPYTKIREVKKVLMVVITSDRGLCGAFNTNVIKAAIAHINENYASIEAAGKLTVMPFGKKALDAFNRRNNPIVSDYVDIFSRLSFDTSREASELIMNAYAEGQYDEVVMVYNEFKNVATQIIRLEQMLPLVSDNQDNSVGSADYIFEPSEEEIILELIPKAIKMKLFKALLDSNASEHGARMTSMDKATENAGEMLKALKIEYNRSRQAAITNEILEIVGGAEALKGN